MAGKITFNVGEQEFIEVLREGYGMTKLEAIEHVIKYKREQMAYYEHIGNLPLAKQLKKELGED